MISAEQKKQVQDTFMLLLPEAEEFAARFYIRLFELAPGLRPMFHISIREQERKLVDMLCVVIYGLDHPDQLIIALHSLGQLHSGYGVKPEHFKVLEEALLWALGQQLGEHFTPEVHSSWQAMYEFMMQTMLQAYAKTGTADQALEAGV